MAPSFTSVLGAFFLTTWLWAASAMGQGTPPSPQERPAPDTVVSLTQRLKAGDHFELEVRKTKTPSKGPDTPLGPSRVDVDVLSEAAEGEVTVAWTTHMPVIPESAGPIPAALAKAMDGLRLEFSLDADGVPGELKNFDAVKAQVDAATDTLLKSLEGRGLDKKVLESVRAMMVEMYRDRERATMLFMQEPSGYFSGYGWAFSQPAEIHSQHVEQNNPLGGEPIPSELVTGLENYDPADPTIVVKMRQTADPEKTLPIMLASLAGLSAKAGRPMTEKERATLQSGEFGMTTDIRCVYNRASGLIERTTIRREVMINSAHQMETIEFTLVDHPPVLAAPPSGP